MILREFMNSALIYVGLEAAIMWWSGNCPDNKFIYSRKYPDLVLPTDFGYDVCTGTII